MSFDISKTSIYGIEIICILLWFGPAIMKALLHIKIYFSKFSYDSSVQFKRMYEMYMCSSSDTSRGPY